MHVTELCLHTDPKDVPGAAVTFNNFLFSNCMLCTTCSQGCASFKAAAMLPVVLVWLLYTPETRVHTLTAADSLKRMPCKLSCTLFCGRCNTSAFISSSTDWKKKAASDAHTLSEYAQLFGADEATPGAEESADVTDANVMIEDTNTTAAAATPEAADATAGKPKKKRKKDMQGGNADQAELMSVAASALEVSVNISDEGHTNKSANAEALSQVKLSKKSKKAALPAVSDGVKVPVKQLGTDKAMALLGCAAGQQKPHAKKNKTKKKDSVAK